ncbi:MAG: DUF502 domain-containing protein [Burkholderiales bacterium]|nr:DUF502 domain-containing protein [Burkholderiales bacterium]MBK8665343.1 DUF502 domain-containing protein [Burkholderiales bacterium]
MADTPKRFQPLRPLLTGLLALLPLAATLVLLVWAWKLAADWLGPRSAIGSLLTSLGLGMAADSVLPGYLLGLLAIVVLVYGFGLLVEAGLQRGVDRIVKALMQRIPVVRTVYDVLHRLVGLISKPKDEGLNSMSPVWLYFGGLPADGAAADTTVVLGLLTTHEPVLLGGQPFHGVLVPTAPVPVGGGLLFVPAHWVVPAEIGIEGVTSIYVSMGVTAGQYLHAQAPAQPPKSGPS